MHAPGPTFPDSGRPDWVFWSLLGVSSLLAVLSARPYAGSWNDGSRLAAVEAIADHHTLTIDHSIFVQVPQRLSDANRPPYAPSAPSLLAAGTKDKLFINGHYYSDKPTVVSFLLAGVYLTFQELGLPPAAARPDLFCWGLTIASSGLAYITAVMCMYLLCRQIGLSAWSRLLVAGSLAFATVALPYARHVNNHIMLLGVLAALLLQLVCWREEIGAGRASMVRLVLIGTLTGLGYNLDLGAGPALVVGVIGLAIYRSWPHGLTTRLTSMLGLLLGLAPWLIAHHYFNYMIGGVMKPMNAVPEYLQWPGSPFDPSNLTGLWRHGPLKLTEYALALLFGKHGFIGHNLPLFLLFPALVRLWRSSAPEKPEACFAVGWCAATWLMYACFSNNYGGACLSVRWFVPMLAPAALVLALHLRDEPRAHRLLLIVSLWGLILTTIMWRGGPWILRMVPGYWPIQAGALLCWAWFGRRKRSRFGERISQRPTIRARFTSL